MHQSHLIDQLGLMYNEGMASSAVVASAPPDFLRLVGHPLRWRLMGELAQSDRSVRELTGLVGEPQNLVSYHLGKLRAAGVVSARRSAADGRDSYYSVDLDLVAAQLRATGDALHPSFGEPGRPAARGRRKPSVLFLCTGNSARSQMAAALTGAMSEGRVTAASAGSHPKALHPNAVRAMKARGIDIAGNRATRVDQVVAGRYDVVVTLCDRVREVCPEFPSHPQLVHWSLPDPASGGGSHRESYPAFERAAADLERRIGHLLVRLDDPSTTQGRSPHARQ